MSHMMPVGRSPKFKWELWWWTLSHENLFDLSKDELAMFKGFVRQAT